MLFNACKNMIRFDPLQPIMILLFIFVSVKQTFVQGES